MLQPLYSAWTPEVIITLSGGVSAVYGLLILEGWYTQHLPVVQPHPTFAPVQSNTAGKALVARDGRFPLVNQSFCTIVGYAKHELLTTTFPTIIHPDELEANLAFARPLLADERTTYRLLPVIVGSFFIRGGCP